MKNFLLSIFLLCVSCVSFAGTIKVMSLNVAQEVLTDDPSAPFYGNTPPWDYRKDELYHTIKIADPDVLALQEDSTRQKNEIFNRFGTIYGLADTRGHYHPGDDVYPPARNHHSILYRKDMFSLLEQGSFTTLVERRCWWAKLKKLDTGTEFYVFNLHWHGVNQERYDIRLFNNTEAGVWSVAGNNPVVLLGDFNSNSNINNNIGADRLDALLSYKNKHRKYNYLKGHRPLNISLDRIIINFDGVISEGFSSIDHILTSRDIKRDGSYQHYKKTVHDAPSFIEYPYATDHPAVMVRMKLPGEKPINMAPIINLLLLDQM